MYLLNQKFQDAMNFASIKHIEQFRKGTQTPYIVHPISVAQILFEATYKDVPRYLSETIIDIICAGVLHDTLEDTDATETEIIDKFGIRVLNYIKDASEDDKSLPWKERKLKTISKLKTLAPLSLMVPLADKIHNLSEIDRELQQLDSSSKEHYWDKFNAGYEEQKWYYESIFSSIEYNKGDYPHCYIRQLMRQYEALILKVFFNCNADSE